MATNKREAGAVAVEFALLLPVFLLIVLGTIDWGWYFFIDQFVANAAREGARVGAAAALGVCVDETTDCSSPTRPGTIAACNFLTAANLRASARSVSVYCYKDSSTAAVPDCSPVPGGGVKTVCSVVSYPTRSLTGFLGNLVPSAAKAVVTMRQEN